MDSGTADVDSRCLVGVERDYEPPGRAKGLQGAMNEMAKIERGERWALGRCIFWIFNALPALILLPGSAGVKYIIAVSIYANIESAYSSYSAKRAERRGLEE